MMDFLRRHMRIIFIITIAGFLGGAFVGFGGYFFGGGSLYDSAAEVNGNKISIKRYNYMLNRVLDNLRNNNEEKEISNETMAQKRREVLQDLIQQEVFWIESKKYGITVSDSELASDIQHYPAFQKDGQFDRRAYFQILYQVLRTTPQEFEDIRRKQIARFKLQYLLSSSVIITEPELQLEYAGTHKGDFSKFEKDRVQFLESLKQEKTMMVLNEWFRQLNNTLKIRVFLDDIERRTS